MSQYKIKYISSSYCIIYTFYIVGNMPTTSLIELIIKLRYTNTKTNINHHPSPNHKKTAKCTIRTYNFKIISLNYLFQLNTKTVLVSQPNILQKIGNNF